MRIIAVVVLLVGLLMLLGMSFLRINNLEYDVGVLAKEVQKLKASAAAGAPVAALPVAEPTAAPVGRARHRRRRPSRRRPVSRCPSKR